EGLHAEQRVVARHAVRPLRQGARDSVAQHTGVAGEEIDLVAGEKSERIARMLDGNILERGRSLVPAAARQMTEGRDMGVFAGSARQQIRRGMAFSGEGGAFWFGGQA